MRRTSTLESSKKKYSTAASFRATAAMYSMKAKNCDLCDVPETRFGNCLDPNIVTKLRILEMARLDTTRAIVAAVEFVEIIIVRKDLHQINGKIMI